MRRVRVAIALLAACLLAPAPAAAIGLADEVDTRIGTDEGAQDFGTGGGAGATFPGATAPFGQVQLTPQTDPSVRNFGGGYTASDTRIKGFAATQISGAGCANLGTFPVQPTAAPIERSPAVRGSYDVAPEHVRTFAKDDEVARPGDYRATLDPGTPTSTRVETTAVTRAGLLRLTLPTDRASSLLVNAGGSQTGDFDAGLRVDPERREISGTVRSGQFSVNRNRFRQFVVVRFDRAPAASGVWREQTLTPGGRETADDANLPPSEPVPLQYKRIPGGPTQLAGNPSSGAQAGAYVTFAAGTDSVVARVGVSSVSVDAARANLDAEAPETRSFDDLRAQATGVWERTLDRVQVRGGRPEHRRQMATALYHSHVGPNTFSDADGRYRGMDGQIHRAEGYTKLANVSGWDVYRSQVPLLAMLRPEVVRDLGRSLLADHAHSGALPKWPVMEDHTNVMVGDPADVMLATARAYGVADVDHGAGLRAAVAGAERESPTGRGYVQRPGLGDYRRLGWVGHEQNTDVLGHTADPSRVWGSAGTTLEYAVADFSIARLAQRTGDRPTCERFAPRSRSWQNVLDPQTRTMRPRFADGRFDETFDPASDEGFPEGSAAQYTWAAPQDLAGLIERLGGREAVRGRLRDFLRTLNSGGKSTTAFLGNEPNLHVPWIANWTGAPAIGQEALRSPAAAPACASPAPTPPPCAGSPCAAGPGSWPA